MAGVELSVADEADASCAVAAVHLERLVEVQHALGHGTLQVLRLHAAAELNDSMLTTRLETSVHRKALTYTRQLLF